MKYYKLKSNGEMAKSGMNIKILDKEACYIILDYGYDDIYTSVDSLYDLYKKILKRNEGEIGYFYDKSFEVTLQTIKNTISSHVEKYEEDIQNKIVHETEILDALKAEYESNVGKIDFDLKRRKVILKEYAKIKFNIENLNNKKINIISYDSMDYKTESLIMPDIKPIEI